MVVSQSYARIFFRNCVSTYASVHHDAMDFACLKIMVLFVQHFTVLIWHGKTLSYVLQRRGIPG